MQPVSHCSGRFVPVINNGLFTMLKRDVGAGAGDVAFREVGPEPLLGLPVVQRAQGVPDGVFHKLHLTLPRQVHCERRAHVDDCHIAQRAISETVEFAGLVHRNLAKLLDRGAEVIGLLVLVRTPGGCDVIINFRVCHSVFVWGLLSAGTEQKIVAVECWPGHRPKHDIVAQTADRGSVLDKFNVAADGAVTAVRVFHQFVGALDDTFNQFDALLDNLALCADIPESLQFTQRQEVVNRDAKFNRLDPVSAQPTLQRFQ